MAEIEDDECPLCGGCGEVNAYSAITDNEVVPCPTCMAVDHEDEVAAIRRQLEAANARTAALLQECALAQDAMRKAIRLCQEDVSKIVSGEEHRDVAKKRLAIFRELDIPLARFSANVSALNTDK